MEPFHGFLISNLISNSIQPSPERFGNLLRNQRNLKLIEVWVGFLNARPLLVGNVAEPVLGSGAWTDTHATYAEFVRKKKEKRFFETVDMGAALSKEITDEVLADKARHDEQQEKTAREYIRDHRRKMQRTIGPEKFVFDGKLVWLDDSVSKRSVGGHAHASSMKCSFVDKPVGAHVVVSPTPSYPNSLEAFWSLCLNGGYSCSIEFFKSGGSSGTAVRFHQATADQRRTTWVSPLFVKHHPRIAEIIFFACLSAGSKWQLVDSMDQCKFLTAVDRATRAGRPNSVLAFLEPSEFDAAEFSNCIHKYMLETALASLLKVDAAGTHSGLH